MKRSTDKLSSDKSMTEADVLFSFKRYFINNVDSYHGDYILKEVSKVLEKNATESVKQYSQTVLGEDAVDMGLPSPPEQPYEIIGKK